MFFCCTRKVSRLFLTSYCPVSKNSEDTSMLSRNIVFIGKDQVKFVKDPVRDPGSGEVMLKARKTLISTGTEGICLIRLFEPGSHWDRWVTYPFYPNATQAQTGDSSRCPPFRY